MAKEANGIVDNRTDNGIVGNCRSKDVCGKNYREANSLALKSIGCNQGVCENGEDGAIFALTSYCCRTSIGARAELPPRFGKRPMLSAPLRSRRNHAENTLLPSSSANHGGLYGVLTISKRAYISIVRGMCMR